MLLLHYFPDRFYRWCEMRQLYWTRETLNLLGAGDLHEILSCSTAKETQVIRNSLAGLTMTFSAVCSARVDSA